MALAALRSTTKDGLSPADEHASEGRDRVAAAIAASRARLGAAAERESHTCSSPRDAGPSPLTHCAISHRIIIVNTWHLIMNTWHIIMNNVMCHLNVNTRPLIVTAAPRTSTSPHIHACSAQQRRPARPAERLLLGRGGCTVRLGAASPLRLLADDLLAEVCCHTTLVVVWWLRCWCWVLVCCRCSSCSWWPCRRCYWCWSLVAACCCGCDGDHFEGTVKEMMQPCPIHLHAISLVALPQTFPSTGRSEAASLAAAGRHVG